MLSEKDNKDEINYKLRNFQMKSEDSNETYENIDTLGINISKDFENPSEKTISENIINILNESEYISKIEKRNIEEKQNKEEEFNATLIEEKYNEKNIKPSLCNNIEKNKEEFGNKFITNIKELETYNNKKLYIINYYDIIQLVLISLIFFLIAYNSLYLYNNCRK